ncbi:MAG: DUF4860 domain-containing protein [Raoultibacter sp.]
MNPSTPPYLPSPPKPRGDSEHFFVATLFAVIVLFLLIALMVGTSLYQAVNNERTADDKERLGLALITNSVRANDATDAVGSAQGPEGRALVLAETLEDGGTYETRIYRHHGRVVQEYATALAPYTPEKAREIVASETFEFTYRNNLLTIETDQGSTAVALRSVRGGK